MNREGRTEPAAPSSYFKSWSDWAKGKTGSLSKKGGETPVHQGQTPESAATGGWSDWAFQKITSFSGQASKNAGKAAEKATNAGKEKLKAEGEAAAKEGQDMWEGTKGGVKEGSQKAKEYAKQGSEKAKEYVGKTKEGAQQKADKTYETGKDVGNQATQKVKEEAEL